MSLFIVQKVYIWGEISLKGVYETQKKDGSVYYRASFTYKGKHISLGSFDNEVKANQAYAEAGRLIGGRDITIDNYAPDSALPFEKWVVIINFRDNGLYFSTPIYARPKFFYYYLSPSLVLKFDIDDLFYYSSHKIMKRNGHLFVADYGMQVSILSRYDIKSFAVAGRDYVFLNGDDTDFRRQNIKIINRYNGVYAITAKGRTKYKAKINVPGYYIIGVYKSELEAAVAYNKAVDILKRNGVKKNYTPNYIDGLSPSAYADIYSKLKISDKIENYKARSNNGNAAQKEKKYNKKNE